MTTTSRKFSMGRLLSTPGALAACAATGEVPHSFLARHERGDWGDLSKDDLQANEDALKEGLRLLSAYHLKDGTKIWLITEWDRSATTLLLPSEY